MSSVLLFRFRKTCSLFLVLCVLIATSNTANAQLFGGGIDDARETTQLRIEGLEGLQSVTLEGMFGKDNVLDGLAWAVAKQAVSEMTQGLIDWVNSGFQGSPAFVTDINGLMMDAADQAAGEYIESLGGIGETLCSPFSLDVQVALSLSFAAERSGESEAACTLTDIEDNLEGFLSGTMDNWGQWIQVTTNPQNTPYGAYLTAEQEMYAAIQTSQDQTLEVASWGDGFLSKKICEAVEGTYTGNTTNPSGTTLGSTQGATTVSDPSGATGGANCIISTPGQVISEQLNQQLGRAGDSLVEADEINELIAALLNQLTLQAVQGINGLLGLSSGTGYTDYSYEGSTGSSYLDAMVAQQAGLNFDLYASEIDASLTLEQDFLNLINTTASSARAEIANQEALIDRENSVNDDDSNTTIENAEDYIDALNDLIVEVNSYRATTTQNVAELKDIQRRFTQGGNSATSTKAQEEAVLDFVELRSSNTLISKTKYDQLKREWGLVLD